jgi:cell division protein FtsA
LTGGGAQLDGLLEIAEEIFDCGVRYGLPRGLGGLVDVIGSPAWGTAAGLLLHGTAIELAQSRSGRRRSALSVRGVVGSLRGMFSDLL